MSVTINTGYQSTLGNYPQEASLTEYHKLRASKKTNKSVWLFNKRLRQAWFLQVGFIIELDLTGQLCHRMILVRSFYLRGILPIWILRSSQISEQEGKTRNRPLRIKFEKEKKNFLLMICNFWMSSRCSGLHKQLRTTVSLHECHCRFCSSQKWAI